MKENPVELIELPGLKCISFDFSNRDLFEIARQIRHTTFVLEQGVDPEIELDGLDDVAQHYLIQSDTDFLAAARYRLTDQGIKIERFAVKKDFRSKHIGSFLINHMLDELKNLRLPIYLHAQDTAVNFYLKHGFEIHGDAFTEADIIHYHMFLKTEDE